MTLLFYPDDIRLLMEERLHECDQIRQARSARVAMRLTAVHEKERPRQQGYGRAAGTVGHALSQAKNSVVKVWKRQSCATCATKMPIDANFCMRCGTPLL